MPRHQDEDIAYIAEALRRDERGVAAPSIYLLWAALIGIGFVLTDLAPWAAASYWLVAAPSGTFISIWLGAQHAKRIGQASRRIALTWIGHWLIVLVALGLATLPGFVGQRPLDELAPGVLLIVALAYALATVHLDRGHGVAAAVMAVGYVALTVFEPPWLWSASGSLVALALTTSAIRARRAA